MDIFEVVDKTGRKIRLTKRQYSHLLKKHPYMNKYMEEIKETIQNPDKITFSNVDKDVRYYYKDFKSKDMYKRYLLVSVKYLNGEGYIITSFFTNKITGVK